MNPQGILETAIYAADLEAAERFYSDVLGLAVFSREPGRHVFFRSGAGMFLVFNPNATTTGETRIGGVAVPRHGATGPGHMAFRIRESDLPAWRQHLSQNAILLDAEIAWPNGGKSLYFRDPAGNSIELATARLWGLAEE